MFENSLKIEIPCRQNPNLCRKNDANFIQLEVSYTLGGTNWFTGKPEPRGYYLHASPVLKANRVVTYQGFSGAKFLLLEVGRRSQKKEAQAALIAEGYVQKMIDHVCAYNNLEVCAQ